MADIATLGIEIRSEGAVRSIQLTREELVKLANAGRDTEGILKRAIPATIAPPATVQHINRVTEAMQRMRQAAEQSRANAMASQIGQLDPFQKQAQSLQQMAVAASSSGVEMGKLRQGMTSLAIAAGALPGPLGRIASTLAPLAIGGGVTVAVLAGITALSFAWTTFTEEADKARAMMEKIHAMELQFSAQSRATRLADLDKQEAVAKAKLDAVTGLRGSMSGPAGIVYDLFNVREARKLEAEILDIRTRRAALGQVEVVAEREAAAAARTRAGGGLGAGAAPARSGSATGWNVMDPQGFFRKLMQDRIDGAKRVSDAEVQAAAEAARAWEETHQQQMRETQKLVDQITFALEDLASFGVGKVAQAAGPLGGFVSGVGAGLMSGNPYAAAAGGLMGLVDVMLSSNDAAEEYADTLRQLQEQFDAFSDSVEAQLGILSSTEMQLRDLKRQFEEARRVLAAAHGVTGQTIEDFLALADAQGIASAEHEAMRKALNDLNALEALRAEQIRQQVVELNVLMQEDLNVRLLRAQGRTEEADAMADALARQREYADAVKAGADATTLAALAEVQRAEAISQAMSKIQARIDSFSATISGLQDFQNALKLGDASLSPTARLAEANLQYQKVLDLAMGGDQAAAGRLPGSAQALLDASRAVNASGPAFQADFLRVLADTQAAIDKFTDLRTIEELMLDELKAIRGNTEPKPYGDVNPNAPPIGLLPPAPPVVLDPVSLDPLINVSQDGFRQTILRLETLTSRVDALTTATRQAFDGLQENGGLR